MPSGGLFLGQKNKNEMYYAGDDLHSLIIGATRSGKGRNCLLQTIGIQALASESMILSDPKGELYNYTSPFLRRMGYEVKVIDFKNPFKSSHYNFLQPVIDEINKGNVAKAVNNTWDITSSFVGEAKGEKIWNNGEASVIASSILSVCLECKEERNKNMTNVYHFISNMANTQFANPLTNFEPKMAFEAFEDMLDVTHPARALLGIANVAPARTRGSFFTSALSTLKLFTDDNIYYMTKESEFNIKDFAEKKMALFLILPDEKTTYYTLASLIINQIYQELVSVADNRGGRLKNRINFNLDEFGNFAKIPDFGAKLTVGGGRGIRFNLFVQGLNQLDEKYDKNVAETIKGNCHIWVYLFTKDFKTKEEISKALGNYTINVQNSSYSFNRRNSSSNSTSRSGTLTHRALLTPDEVGRIARPYSLVMYADKDPAVFNAPDVSKTIFNEIYGLGSKEHNRKVIEIRESKRYCYDGDVNVEIWKPWLTIEEEWIKFMQEKESADIPGL